MRIGKAYTGHYWKYGDIQKIGILSKLNVSRIRAGKHAISMQHSFLLSVCSKIIGYTDIESKDWYLGSRGKSDHPAFEPLYGDSRIWAKRYND